MLFADPCLGQHPGGEVVEPAVERPAVDDEAEHVELVRVLEARGAGAAVRADAHLEVGLGELAQVLWAGNLCVLDL